MNKLFKYCHFVFFIMASSLAYAQTSDIDAFKLNQTQKFFTKDHPKAKGINISLKYPKSWIAEEGERPNIVQKFIKVLDDGITISCMIAIWDIPEAGDFSDEEIVQEIFSEEGMKLLLGPNSKLLKHMLTKYDGQPGALSSGVTVEERSGIKVCSYFLRHTFVYSKKVVLVGCAVIGLLSNANKIEELYKKYEPLFLQIGNSIVIHDKWEHEKKETLQSLQKERSTMEGEFRGLNLLISLFLTWGIGLLPPVIIRYVLIRKPISKIPAIVVAGIFCILNLCLFIALGSQNKTHYALILVAVVSYYILRAGHKKSVNNQKP